MTEQEIRKRYQRSDETDSRGTNIGAIDNFINMLNMHKNNSNEYVRSIAEHFGEFEKLAPNFIIFESQNPEECFYMHNFAAFQIGKETDSITSSHEFGHAVIRVTSKTKVPKGYENVISRAKSYALSPENKEKFKSYIMYLSQRNNQDRTEAEKRPVSDIISSIFQQPGFRIGSYENVCMLPGYHNRDYYFNEEKNSIKVDKIYDEDFANYYALKANNCDKELDTLKELFGEEIFQVLDSELLKAAVVLERVTAKEHSESTLSTMDSIKNVITGITIEDIQLINNPEKEDEIQKNEGENR